MSSVLRSTSVPAGYFVMSSDSLLSGLGYELFKKVGDEFVYDNDLAALLASGSTFTWRDLGLTEYRSDLSGTPTLTGPVDLRKVRLVSGLAGGIDGTAFDGTARYVPLGTNLKTSTPHIPSRVKSSVFLVGKIL